MITFKAIVIPNNKRKDGTYPVKIRVTFKGVTRRLPTTMVCRQADLTRSLKIKSADILNRTDEIIGQMRKVAMGFSPFDLEDHDVDWVVAKIKGALSDDKFSLDFFEWGDSFVLAKTTETRRMYMTALNTFERFLGKRHIDINDITKSMIMDFVEWNNAQPKMHYSNGELKPIEKEKKGNRQTTTNVIMLSSIFVAARNRYNDVDEGKILIPRQPFATIPKTLPPSDGQKNLGQELMQRIIDAETDSVGIRIALDAFIVSFGLMGANMADLFNAPSFKGETWKYNRAKTKDRRVDHAEMRVDIPPQLHPYLARLQGKGEWWLNVLHDFNPVKNQVNTKVNDYLSKWCEQNGISKFTFYAARHTWASLARKAGVEKATIDECLAHKGEFEMADIYAERDWQLLQEANRKVLDLFQWKRED